MFLPVAAFGTEVSLAFLLFGFVRSYSLPRPDMEYGYDPLLLAPEEELPANPLDIPPPTDLAPTPKATAQFVATPKRHDR